LFNLEISTLKLKPKAVTKKKVSKKKLKFSSKWMIIGVLSLVFVFIVLRKWVFPNHVPAAASMYKVTGIDVSKHTGEINWKKIKESGVTFAYIKATEGLDYVDPQYADNLKGARDAGILLGAYHFFRFNKDGKKQALHFAKNCKLRRGDLLPVLDVERWGNMLSTASDKVVIQEIGEFLVTVEKKLGARPMIYTNEEAYNRFIKGNYDLYPLWFCDLEDEPDTEAPGWDFWQYSHHGEIEGSPEEVDLNVFRRTKAQLDATCRIR
jgi:lysozyme